MNQDIFEQLFQQSGEAPQPQTPPPVRVAVDYSSLKLMLEDLIEAVKELKEQGSYSSTVIYDLTDNYSLRQPIHVVLQESDEVTIAMWPELHLFADGDNPNSAISRLKEEIIALYDDLISTPEPQLGALPHRWLRTLRAVIQTNG